MAQSTKHYLLRLLRLLKTDLEMLRDGNWVPDEDSCQASIDNCDAAIALVKEKL